MFVITFTFSIAIFNLDHWRRAYITTLKATSATTNVILATEEVITATLKII